MMLPSIANRTQPLESLVVSTNKVPLDLAWTRGMGPARNWKGPLQSGRGGSQRLSLLRRAVLCSQWKVVAGVGISPLSKVKYIPESLSWKVLWLTTQSSNGGFQRSHGQQQTWRMWLGGMAFLIGTQAVFCYWNSVQPLIVSWHVCLTQKHKLSSVISLLVCLISIMSSIQQAFVRIMHVHWLLMHCSIWGKTLTVHRLKMNGRFFP